MSENIMSILGSGRRIEVAASTSNYATLARERAKRFVEVGRKSVLDKIYARIESESGVGRLQMMHVLKNNENSFANDVISSLKEQGFTVEVGPTSQREPETVLDISW